jgi:predicted NAD-dependent protein-ADP-ribosyltransferase YbiA (DUF1768 family)
MDKTAAMEKKEHAAQKKMEKEAIDNLVLSFFFAKKIGTELSNFYMCPIEIEFSGTVRCFSSGEKAFHGMKYIVISKELIDEVRKSQLSVYGSHFEVNGLFDMLNGPQVKAKGGRNGMRLEMDELSIWGEKCVAIQRQICTYKFLHEEKVRVCLQTHKYKVLIHPALRVSLGKMKNCVWEGRGMIVEGELVILGGNMLGKIWMEIRDKFM